MIQAFWAGLRMRRARDPAGLTRFAGVLVVSFLGVVTLQCLFAAANILQAQQVVEDSRTVVQPVDPNRAKSFAGTAPAEWNGDRLTRVIVATKSPGAPPPPGVPAFPRPGEAYVSAAVLEQARTNPALDDFVKQARVAGLIERQGLTSPDELRVVQGIRYSASEISTMTPVLKYGGSADPRVPFNGPLAFFLPLGLLLALGPMLLALVLCLRLKAQEVAHRAAILRSLGASPFQVRALAAAEVAPAGAIGCLAGWLSFSVLRTSVTRVPGTDLSFWPADDVVGWISQTATVLGVMSLVVTAPMIVGGQRPVSTRPVREPRPTRPWWPAFYVLGLALLAAAAAFGTSLPGGPKRFIVFSVAIACLGFIPTMHWVIDVLSRLLAARAPSGATLIAARRMSTRSGTPFKLAVAIGVAFLLFAVMLPFSNLLERDESVGRAGLAQAHGYVVFVSEDKVSAGELRRMPGVVTTLDFSTATDGAGSTVRTLQASCQQLRVLVTVRNCGGTFQWIAIRPTLPSAFSNNYRAPIRLGGDRLMRDLPTSVVLAAMGEEFQGSLRVAESKVSARPDGHVVLVADGNESRAAFEARFAVVDPNAYYSNTYAEIVAQARSYLPYVQVLQLGGAVGLSCLVLALVAAVTRAAKERARQSAALRLIGAGVGTRVASHLVENALPSLVGQTLMSVAASVTWWSLYVVDSQSRVGPEGYVFFVLAPLVTTALVTTLTLPAAVLENGPSK